MQDVKIATLLRVIRDRWDATAETLAEVDSVRQAGGDGRVVLYRAVAPTARKRAVHRDHSLNLFENDPADMLRA
jgi:hypothetical protein